MRNGRRFVDKSNDRAKMIDNERAIFIQGDLNETLVASLTPQILSLTKTPENLLLYSLIALAEALAPQKPFRDS